MRQQWGGRQWQEYCRSLLGARYTDHQIQFIPDRAGGDGGLEAYLFDGVGYQCYAPDEVTSTQALLEAQKKKIRDDTRRLTADPVGTGRLLGGIVLRRWVLLTPEFDSRELVEYARAKSKRIREAVPRPAWCTPDLEIVVATDAEFAAERAALVGQLATDLRLDLPAVTEEDAYRSVGDGQARTLTEKLLGDPSLAASPEDLANYRSELLISWVRGAAQLESLRIQYEELHAAVHATCESARRTIRLRTSGGALDGTDMLPTVADRLAQSIKSAAPGVSLDLCEELAWSTVAGWLVDCPLRFKSVVSQ